MSAAGEDPAAAVDALCAEVARLVGVEPERALALAAEADRLAAAGGDAATRGKGARAMANALHFSGRSAEAQEHYARALELFVAGREALQAAITRSSALLNLAYLGDADAAVAWYGAARSTFAALGDRPRAAVLEHNYANVLYRQDRWQEALDRYLVAHRALADLGRSFDAAVCLRNIAVCRISLEQFPEALAAYEECRAYAAREGLDQLRREADYNVAYLAFLRGEYTRAIDLFGRAREDAEAAGDTYHAALSDLDLSEIYLEVNLVADAARLAARAARAFTALEMPYEAAKATVYGALAQGRQRRVEAALAGLGRARETFVAEENRLWPALVDFYRAVVLARAGRLDEALPQAERAFATFAGRGVTTRAALSEVLLADLALAGGDVAGARRRAESALERLRELAPPALQVRAYRVLGQVEESDGDREAALAAYRRAAEWLERSWSQLAGDDVKIAFTEDKKELFESLVALTLKADGDGDGDEGGDGAAARERAFAFVESAKSRALQDLLGVDDPPASAAATPRPRLLARAGELRRDLHALYHALDRRQLEPAGAAAAPGAPAVLRLQAAIRERETELLGTLRGLEAADPERATMAGGAAGLEAVRRALPAKGVLVEYFVARGHLLAFAVDGEGLDVTSLGRVAPIRELHALLDFQLTRARDRPRRPGSRELDAAATRSHLAELWERLVAPLAGRLADREHLVVVPHGFLHRLPFHALGDDGAPLVERLAVSYAPSAAVFALCAGKRATWEERALVAGVADELAPRIADEARAVAALLPRATLLLGEEATVEALAREGRTARYVHLATHGIFRRDHPMFSALRLGSGRLALADLYRLRLAAELVTLSGCGTGLAAVHGADELVGLTRGMLYAGAHAVLVSLWEVDDAAAGELMSGFYRHLLSGRRPAAALRDTMRELRARHPDPARWAAFALVGRP